MFWALFSRRGATTSQSGRAERDTANDAPMAAATGVATGAAVDAAATGVATDAAVDAAASPTIATLYHPKSQSEKITESKSKQELSHFHRRPKDAKTNEIKGWDMERQWIRSY